MRNIFLGLTATILLAACGSSTPETLERSGDWDLKSKTSHILYTTIKNQSIAESNSFNLFSGSVSENGHVEIDIALNSVQTNIDTRDERMKKFVFKTVDYPSAVVKTSLSMDTLATLEVGARQMIEAELAVSLAGQSSNYDAQFMVTRLGVNEVLVESATPIMVQAEDFNLGAGINKLQELAKLQSITPVVPVTFSLVFER